MDTINKGLIIRDTVIKVIEKISESKTNEVEIYKELLTSQENTYNLLITIFLGIIALFAGATWLYNKKLAKSEIISETDRIFKLEKEKLLAEFKEEFRKEINFIKGESARLFALTSTGDDPGVIVNRMAWWITSIKYYRRVGKGEGVRISVTHAIETGKIAISKRLECKSKFIDTYSDKKEEFLAIIEKIPGELAPEKKELKKLIDDLLK